MDPENYKKEKMVKVTELLVWSQKSVIKEKKKRRAEIKDGLNYYSN